MRRVATISLLMLTLTVVGRGQQLSVDQAVPGSSAYIDPLHGLTLDDAIARALAQEPSLRATRSQIDVTRGFREQAALRPNPAVSFSQQQEPAGADNQTRIELQWPLDLFRKTGRLGVADREIEVARHATANRERTLAAEVRVKYGEVVVAVRTLTVTEQLLAATSRQRALIASRVEQGAAPPLDRDMVRVEAQRLEADRLIQIGIVDRQLVDLKRLMGLSPGTPVVLRESLEALVQQDPPVTAADDQAAVATKRSDVQEAQARVRVSDAQVDRAKREGKPDVSLFGMYMRMDAGFPQQGVSASGGLEPIRGVFHYVSVGASVTLPLHNRNQGAVAAARAERAGAAAQLDTARLAAEGEIAAARLRDGHARQALNTFTGDTMALARHNLDIVRQTYELGRITLLDVLNEQRRYLDLERAYTDVLREAYQARQALRSAQGEVR